MKNLFYITLCCLLAASCSKNRQSAGGGETQAFLGVKQGGEWLWVTKSDGKKQFEYHGGTFKPVTELRVPEQHTDHSFYIQYEGPGWESEKIGYRIYLDWRNAIDIFGKKVDTMVLHKVGLDVLDSYHEIAGWGVDVLKVGESLGLGSLAFWNGEKAIRIEKTDSIKCVVKNHKNHSVVLIDYFGWQINQSKTHVFSSLEIEKGSYLTKYHVRLSGDLPNMSTGIVKLPGAEMKVIKEIKTGWDCLATFGIQSLQDDKLGMCIFFKNDDLIEITADENSHVVVLKPDKKELTYYFGAAWQQDQSGVESMEDFESFLTDQARFIR